jgi:DNA gyrase inhibitor GyrI
MTELKVRIVHLEPMRVACASGFGQSPEDEAWDTLLAWAASKGLLDDLEAVRFFGYNNPDPSPGSPNYGYDQWITVGPDVEAEGDVRIIEFPGGLYAVTGCRLKNIGDAWKQLAAWREDSEYKCAHHQWLEECLTPEVLITPEGQAPAPESAYGDVELDIYLPIAE